MKRLGMAGRLLLAVLIVHLLAVPQPANAAQEGTTITIVHVNDVHSRIEQTDASIGYAKLSSFLAQLKAGNPNTLLLDAGDTLWAIARKHGTTWQKLAELNKLENPGLIFPGQRILLP